MDEDLIEPNLYLFIEQLLIEKQGLRNEIKQLKENVK